MLYFLDKIQFICYNVMCIFIILMKGLVMYQNFVKRVLDIFMALMIFIISLPFLLIIAIAIKIDSKGPVIFKQKRLGKKGKAFNI